MAEISIRPEREYLHEIITKIKKGIYAIPSFQRDFVWKKEQILDLFDSISRGYPIGSILLWKPEPKAQNPLKSRDILTDKIIDDKTPEYYILDGRQRLTSFFGCVIDEKEYCFNDKEGRFEVGYNLAKECFEYIKKEEPYIMKVSYFYDTFILLEKLQRLLEIYKNDSEKAQKYINRAKKINTILQTYQIGEMLLENCDINEASTVFSRLNSKGTDISKVSMLQAVFYNEKDEILISDRINEIISSLGVYSFDTLKPDDILNCCYRYIGRNFYDSQLLKDIEKLNFTEHLHEIEQDIKHTVEFLHDECYVLSSQLIPYVKQLIAIAGFFKEHKSPSKEQKMELKRWFFYTTYDQTFLNSSLTIVREIFRRFEEYIKGEKETAIDYKPIRMDKELNFRFSLSSARTDLLLLAQIRNYACIKKVNRLEYLGQRKLYGSNPIGVIPFFTLEDKEEIFNFENKGIRDRNSYSLNFENYQDIKEQDNFLSQRGKILLKLEKELLESVNIKIQSS